MNIFEGIVCIVGRYFKDNPHQCMNKQQTDGGQQENLKDANIVNAGSGIDSPEKIAAKPPEDNCQW